MSDSCRPELLDSSRILYKLESRPIREELMTIADELIQKGLEQGLERGLERGMEQGMEKGLRIARIQTLEELLGRKISPTEALAEKSAGGLERMEHVLRDCLPQRSAES